MSKREHSSDDVKKNGNKQFKHSFSNQKVEVGMKGFFVSFDRGKQRFCQSNTFKLLNHFSDIKYGPEDGENKDGESEDSDIEASLKNEVTDLKNSTKNKKRRFSLIKTGCSNLIFVKSFKIKPGELIQEIVENINACTSLKSGNIPVIRDVLRVHPVDASCPATISKIEKLAIEFIPEELKKIESLNPSIIKEFCVQCNRRFNEDISSMETIESIREAMEKIDMKWRYNCRSTDVVVIIEIIKSFCSMSVVKHYFKHKKFNIRELINSKSDTKEKPKNIKAEDEKENKSKISSNDALNSST